MEPYIITINRKIKVKVIGHYWPQDVPGYLALIKPDESIRLLRMDFINTLDIPKLQKVEDVTKGS